MSTSLQGVGGDGGGDVPVRRVAERGREEGLAGRAGPARQARQAPRRRPQPQRVGCAVLGAAVLGGVRRVARRLRLRIAAYVYVEADGESLTLTPTTPPPRPGGFAGRRARRRVVSRISSRRWRTRPRATSPTLLRLLPHHRTAAAAAATTLAMSPSRVKAQLEIAKKKKKSVEVRSRERLPRTLPLNWSRLMLIFSSLV